MRIDYFILLSTTVVRGTLTLHLCFRPCLRLSMRIVFLHDVIAHASSFNSGTHGGGLIAPRPSSKPRDPAYRVEKSNKAVARACCGSPSERI